MEIQYTRAVCMFYVVIIQFTRITQSNPTFPHSPHPRVTRIKGLQPRLALAPTICPDQAGESCSNLDVKYEEGYTVDGRQGDCLLLSCTHRHVCRSVFQCKEIICKVMLLSAKQTHISSLCYLSVESPAINIKHNKAIQSNTT